MKVFVTGATGFIGSAVVNESSSAHGGAEYYGFSSGSLGKNKIVNPATYVARKGDKATIISKS